MKQRICPKCKSKDVKMDRTIKADVQMGLMGETWVCEKCGYCGIMGVVDE